MRAERETRALPGYAFVYHVGLSVPDLDAAVEFFTVVFGARELYRSRTFRSRLWSRWMTPHVHSRWRVTSVSRPRPNALCAEAVIRPA